MPGQTPIPNLRSDSRVAWRLPWAATVAALIAFVGLAITQSDWLLMPLLGAGLVATYFSDYRMPARSPRRWIVRAVLFTAIIIFSATQPQSVGIWLFGHSRAVASLCAAELVVQAWWETPSSGGLGTIVLAGLVMVGACNTFNAVPIRFIAPAYLFFTVLSLREFRPRARGQRSKAVPWRRGAALFLVFLMGALLYSFLWYYRLELSVWGAGFVANHTAEDTAGISTEPVLGSTFNLQGSPSRALLLRGPAVEGHLRAMSFDTYQAGRWLPTMKERKFIRILPTSLASTVGDRVTVTRLDDPVYIVYAPLHTAGVTLIQQEAAEYARSTDGPIRTDQVSPYTYTITLGSTPDFQGPFCVPSDAAERARCLDVPDDIDPAVRSLAREITHSNDPRQKIRDVETYLMSHHRYSLTTRPGPGDPVSSFILKKKAAHCEFFASAAVILLRILKVPSRYVIGYYAHEQVGPQEMVVRQRDAHAWAESWVDGTGWVTVEATPASGMPDHLSSSLPLWWQAWEWLQDRWQAFHQWSVSLGRTQLLLLFATTLAPIGFYFLWKGRRRTRNVPAASVRYSAWHTELAELADRFQAILLQNGIPCPPSAPWQEHLKRVERDANATLGTIGNPIPGVRATRQPGPVLPMEEAIRFVREYNSVRFGGEDGPEPIRRLQELLSHLENSAR